MKKRRLCISNPTRPGGLRPVELITDRAKRYRAQRAIAPGPEICGYCGAPSTMVDHVNGDESDGAPSNLLRACRSCNNTKANVMHAAGVGRRTRQYNPDASKGARSLAQWVMAVSSIRRRDKRTGRLMPRDNWKAEVMPVREAVELIRNTPHDRRVEFSQQLAAKRRPRKSKSSGDWDIPF